MAIVKDSACAAPGAAAGLTLEVTAGAVAGVTDGACAGMPALKFPRLKAT